jgi:hypothetical protein
VSDELPECGIYRTGIALAGQEETLPAGTLVYFHNHSEKGPPLVQLPLDNTHNRWTFSEKGWLVEDTGFVEALVRLKPQGYYIISGQHIHVSREEILGEKTLVQLGYNRRGDSILFVGQFDGNTIQFPTQGYRFEAPSVQKMLSPAGFVVPKRTSTRTLH